MVRCCCIEKEEMKLQNDNFFLICGWLMGLSIQKTKVVASGPITSWEIGGETVGKVSDFILGGSKITADGDCSRGIKRCLLLPS